MHDFPFKILHHDCLHSSWLGGETLDPAMAALLDMWCRFSYAGWKIRAVQRHKTSQDTKLQPENAKSTCFFLGWWWSGYHVLKRSPPFLFLGERSKTFSELTDFMDCWTRSASLAEIFSKGRKGSTPVVAPGPLRSQIKMGKARNVCMSYCKMDLILIHIKLWKVTRNAKRKNNSIKSNDITLTKDWILLLCKWKRNNWIENVDLSKQN